MKTKTMALAVLLLASASTAALAQDNDRFDRARERGQERAAERAQAPPQPRTEAPQGGGDRGGWSRGEGGERQRFERPAQPTVAPTPPPAPEARPAPNAGERFRPNDDGQRNWPGRGGQGGGWSGGGSDQPRTGADRQDDEDRDELRQARQWGGRQGERWTFEGDRRVREQAQPQRPQSGWDQRNRQGGASGQDRTRDRDDRSDDRRGDDRNRGDQNRGGWDRNDRNGSGWNRPGGDRNDNRHSWDGDRRDSHGQPRWDRRRYPPIYQSQHRFRGPVWRPPVGYYSRAWVYGDILPRSWFVDDYRIWDWWNYGLPMPPPGYSWVRVGYDALLVDDFDGEVVQVVRLLFW